MREGDALGSNLTERFPNDTPAPGQPGHDEVLDALAAIYERHQAGRLACYGQPG